MNSSSDGVYAKGVGQIVDQLRQEFIDEVKESLEALTFLINEVRHSRSDLSELIEAVQRAAMSLKGQAKNYELPAIATVAMRAEDYLANVKSYPPRTLDDLQVFIETLVDLSENPENDELDISKLVRTLPAKVRLDDSILEVRNVEVLLVMHYGAATHFVEREMQECGYRISTCTSTLDALPLIIHTKPDFVIISAMMPELTGIDLASGLASMPATRNIPTALITSLPADDPYLQLLSDRVPIIHKSASFGDDLAQALSNLFLI
jgi:CheY-like chemotaxis protein